jgi:hypothetical protein
VAKHVQQPHTGSAEDNENSCLNSYDPFIPSVLHLLWGGYEQEGGHFVPYTAQPGMSDPARRTRLEPGEDAAEVALSIARERYEFAREEEGKREWGTLMLMALHRKIMRGDPEENRPYAREMIHVMRVLATVMTQKLYNDRSLQKHMNEFCMAAVPPELIPEIARGWRKIALHAGLPKEAHRAQNHLFQNLLTAKKWPELEQEARSHIERVLREEFIDRACYAYQYLITALQAQAKQDEMTEACETMQKLIQGNAPLQKKWGGFLASPLPSTRTDVSDLKPDERERAL